MTNAVIIAQQGSNNATFRNRIINGAMQIAQRTTSGTSGSTVPTTSATYPSIDRWYAYATGATVTVAQVAGTVPIKSNLAVTGAASVTAVGVGQRIEQLNCYDLAGSTATLSVNISNTLLTTVTWTASYATSADTWSAKTQIATGTFTVTSSLVNYTANISIPSAATTGIEILFTVGAQISGTWTIGNVQLEAGSTASPFEYRSYGTELALCQRYYEKNSNVYCSLVSDASNNAMLWVQFSVQKRASPTMSQTGAWNYSRSGASGSYSLSFIQTDAYGSGMYGNCGAAWVVVQATGANGWIASSEL